MAAPLGSAHRRFPVRREAPGQRFPESAVEIPAPQNLADTAFCLVIYSQPRPCWPVLRFRGQFWVANGTRDLWRSVSKSQNKHYGRERPSPAGQRLTRSQADLGSCTCSLRSRQFLRCKFLPRRADLNRRSWRFFRFPHLDRGPRQFRLRGFSHPGRCRTAASFVELCRRATYPPTRHCFGPALPDREDSRGRRHGGGLQSEGH
jgi:hypothetical protein